MRVVIIGLFLEIFLNIELFYSSIRDKAEKIIRILRHMPYLSLSSVNIYYEDSNDSNKEKDTIVFSHGLLWSCRMFDNQVKDLSKNFRVITFDHRGQGKTQVTKNGYDLETLSEDAKELIIKLDLRKVHFVGLSMGGMVGMRLASRYPDLIKSLILLETSPDPEPKENVSKYKKLNLVAKLFGFRLVTKPIMKIMFSKSFLLDKSNKEVKKYWIKQLRANNRIGITRAVSGVIERKSVFNELKNITCPTLVLVGDEDIATVPEISDRINKAIIGSKLVRIPKAGHTSTVENPEFITNEIKTFLSGLHQ